MLRNPLNVEVTISRLSLILRDAKNSDLESVPDYVEVEVIDDVSLGAKETRTVSPFDPDPEFHSHIL